MHSQHTEQRVYTPAIRKGSHPWILYWVWGIIFLGCLIPSAPWFSQNLVLFGMLGIGMLLAPGKSALSGWWLALALVFVLFSALSFLPSDWFPIPPWRIRLQNLGVDMGSMVVVQWRQALENYGYLILLTISGCWLLSHRPSSQQLRNIALLFTIGVAVYAVLSMTMKGEIPANKSSAGHFGFFPNRNHTGTYLACGAICSVGVILQGLRDRHYTRTITATIALALIAWAIFGWSISRAGIVLLVVGFLLWLLIMGFRYLGKQEIKALSLLTLLGIGSYLVSESQVKTRLTETTGKITSASQAGQLSKIPEEDTPTWEKVDFRVPTMLDTLSMLKDAPITGVGGGQFFYIFPQYRDRTAGLNRTQQLHPESDWLWLASEYGIPAAITFLTLITIASFYSWKHIRKERDRALRAACLTVALLIILHGFFDVPGHRSPLALTSMLFFALSLPANQLEPHAGRIWSSRLFGLILAAFAVHLGWRISHPETPTSLSVNYKAYEEAKVLYQQNSNPSESDTFVDVLNRSQKGEKIVTKALKITPLDARLYRLQGCLMLIFPNQASKVDQTFEIERNLSPFTIATPLQQGIALAPYSKDKCFKTWELAFNQTEKLEKKHPQSINRKSTENQLLRFCSNSRPMKQLAQSWIKSYTEKTNGTANAR